jgi:primosomal protein N' (replication factor Y)
LTSLLDFPEVCHGSHRRVPVLLPVALDQTYDYLVPDGFDLEPGAFLHVPFGARARLARRGNG